MAGQNKNPLMTLCEQGGNKVCTAICKPAQSTRKNLTHNQHQTTKNDDDKGNKRKRSKILKTHAHL